MVPHSRPVLPAGEEWLEVTERLRPSWAADGECVEQFGQTAAVLLGGTHALAVSSGTAALHLALLGVGVGTGDEVILPAYCCSALLNAVALAGGVPVLADCEPGGYNLDPEDASARLTARTRAIVVAHMFGMPAKVEPLLALGVPVIEDCAQSIGAGVGAGGHASEGLPVGGRGAVAISSFYATKVLTTGHGGVVSTRCERTLATVQDRALYDCRDGWVPRYNYGMSELQAALGLWQLDRLPKWLARRQAIARGYLEALGRPAAGAGREQRIWFRFVVSAPNLDEALRVLRQAGVDAKRPVYRPLHHYLGGEFSHAEHAHRHFLSVPVSAALTDSEVERVSAALRQCPQLMILEGNP